MIGLGTSPWKDIDIIITDSGIPDTLREKIEDAGVQIIIAE